jgi:hypothetical protein
MNEMTISNAKYVADNNLNIAIEFTVDGETRFVANNTPGNRHYDEIMRQVAAGTLTIADAD